MAAIWPGAYKSWSRLVAGVTAALATQVNTVYDEVESIQAKLGLAPHGTAATLTARLLTTIDAAGLPVWGTPGTHTLASGQFTPASPWVIIDTEGSAATDNLDTITAGSAGQLLKMRIAADARNVVIRHGVGNIVTPGAANITLDLTSDLAVGIYDAILSKWIVCGYVSADYVAAQIAANRKYAEMYTYDKAVLFQINTTNTYHPFHLVTAGDIAAGPLSGWTFNAGRVVDANISTETNPSASVLLITCSGNHLLTTGDLVALTNMNDAGHNKVTRVTVTAATTFTCDDIAYVAGAGASAGVVQEPAYLLAGSGAAGVYAASFTVDGTAAATGKVWKFELNINLLTQDNVVSERYTSGTLTSVSASGLITVADGDKIWLSGKNATDTGDYTIKHANINVRRI